MPRKPTSRTLLEKTLSKKAKRLLTLRDNAHHAEVELPEMSVFCTQGDLMIERLEDYRIIYAETPNQSVLRTGLEEELAWAIKVIDRTLILEDLADV